MPWSSSDLPKLRNDLSDINTAYAGLKVTDSNHAEKIPKATKIPNTLTGGIGVNANDKNPITVVTLVNKMGMNRSEIVFLIVDFLCLYFL
jgi:hypothetical protein